MVEKRYAELITACFAQSDIAQEGIRAWPGYIDRLSECGRRIDYRTVCAAMCSQGHHDAEDVLNHFMAHTCSKADKFADRMDREADSFSLLMVLFGLRWFAEATATVCSYLGFQTAATEAERSLKTFDHELQRCALHLDSGQFPNSRAVVANAD